MRAVWRFCWSRRVVAVLMGTRSPLCTVLCTLHTHSNINDQFLMIFTEKCPPVWKRMFYSFILTPKSVKSCLCKLLVWMIMRLVHRCCWRPWVQTSLAVKTLRAGKTSVSACPLRTFSGLNTDLASTHSPHADQRPVLMWQKFHLGLGFGFNQTWAK